VLLTINVTGTSYQATVDAAFNTTYNWRVRARQEGATGPWSAASIAPPGKAGWPA